MTIKIGITDCGEKYPIYKNWLKGQSPHIEVIKLNYEQNNLDELNQCDGILLTGGEDVHPKFYNKPEYLPLCNPAFMDEKRDEFEWKVCEYIFENKVPVLGICRGLQVANVFLGGTLIPDIPTAGKNSHSKFYEGKDRYHQVTVLPDSQLSQTVGLSAGEINSAHHQSADQLGNNLKINALSEDGIIEGLEWKTNQDHYLMLVQWHPERIEDTKNPFATSIRASFLEACTVETHN